MRIVFPNEKPPLVAIAEFDFERAPKTSSAAWNYIESLGGSFADTAIHAIFAGREISCWNFNVPESLPRENATITPSSGDILYFYSPAGEARSPLPPGKEMKEICIFYGPDSRLLTPVGWVPGNVFGRITENLEGLADLCRRMRLEGAKQIRFELIK